VIIRLNATNHSPLHILTDFILQAAVPKSMQLELEPPTSTSIAPGGGTTSQVLKVNNPSKASLKMRLKLNFARNGVTVQDQMEVNNFPAVLTQ